MKQETYGKWDKEQAPMPHDKDIEEKALEICEAIDNKTKSEACEVMLKKLTQAKEAGREEREAVKKLIDWVEHDDTCILSRFEKGEPTEDGGYRMKFAGEWYQTRPKDETPKCDCGLDEVLQALNPKEK